MSYPKGLKKDWKKLHDLAVDHGFEYIGINGQGHHQYKHKTNHRLYSFPGSSGDHRALRNAVSDLRRVAALPPLGKH